LTHQKGIRATQLLVQAVWECPGSTRLVGIEKADYTAESEKSYDESTELEQALAGGHMGILLGTENAQNFVLLMDGFAKVSPFLLVPPVAVRVSECTLDAGRVLVATVLYRDACQPIETDVRVIDPRRIIPVQDHCLLRP
jgi:hypothetical protein